MIIVIAAEIKEDCIVHLTLDQLVHKYIWVETASAFADFADADAFIDMNEEPCNYNAIQKPLLINSTTETFEHIDCNTAHTARFCGWNGFASRSAWEVAVPAGCKTNEIAAVLAAIGKEMILVTDMPGLIAARILAVIINEACFAMSEGISDAEQIDIAMKLGTNYPGGPVARGKQIGAERINNLLHTLALENSIYSPHHSLMQYLS